MVHNSAPAKSQTAPVFPRHVKQNIIKQVFYAFTTQKDVFLLKTIEDSLLTSTYKKYQDTPFWELHPEAHFFFKVFYQVFKCFTFSAEALEYTEDVNSLDQWAVITETKRRIRILIMDELAAHTNNVDLEYITALSGEVYENQAAAKMALTICPESTCAALSSDSAIHFDRCEPTLLTSENLHTIRKRLNLAKDSALVIGKDGQTFIVIGVLPSASLHKVSYFSFSGAGGWSFQIPDRNVEEQDDTQFSQSSHCIVRYFQGTLMFPLMDSVVEISETIKQDLEKSGYSDYDVNRYLVNILTMIRATDQCRKGAVLIISDKDIVAEESCRIAKLGKRGTFLPLSPNILPDNNSGMLQRLADIDGAIMADFDGLCHSCGTILDGYWAPGTGHGNTGRGARYNSTKVFVQEIKQRYGTSKPLFGIVKSEDGMLDFFSSFGTNI